MTNPLTDNDLFLAIDGGGSKTLAVAARLDGTVIAVGHGGPTNTYFVEIDQSIRSLDEAAEAAMEAPEIGERPIRLAVITGPVHRKGVGRWNDRVREFAWTSEGHAAMAAAGETRGIAVIAGTGSGAGLVDEGIRRWAGGWGAVMGDEGSGYDIAVAGLRAIAKAADGRMPPTELTARATAFFGVDAPRALTSKVHDPKTRRHHIAAFCREVLEAAETDSTARAILEHAMAELALCALAGGREVPSEEPIPVVISGGVFRGSRLAREIFAARIREALPNARVISPRFVPAIGALLWAWRKNGYAPGEEVLARLEASYAERENSCR